MSEEIVLSPNKTAQERTVAYVAPFVVFMLFLGLPDLLVSVGVLPSAPNSTERASDIASASDDAAEHNSAAEVGGSLDEPQDAQPWYVHEPRLWLYPLQTIVCLLVLAWFWKFYEFQPHSGWLRATAAGTLGIAVWIAPGFLFQSLNLAEGWWQYLGFAPRTDGFDPSFVKQHSDRWYGAVVLFRFIRMVVVVPLVEEIFWRGFLMRFVADLDGDYWQVPFGTFHKRSLIVVTAMFVLVHSPVDYVGATFYGLLAYAIAVKTKSLSACVLMHAVANLLLGLYVISTAQWGYW